MGGESEPGVPEALPRVLRAVAERLGAEAVDRLWIFPPMRKGRKEWGLVAVSLFDAGAAAGDASGPAEGAGGRTPGLDRDRRRLYTASYTAERTGMSLAVEPVLSEQGSAPLELLPRVMAGVVRRSGDERGEAREVVIGGDPAAFDELVEEYDAWVSQQPGGLRDP